MTKDQLKKVEAAKKKLRKEARKQEVCVCGRKFNYENPWSINAGTEAGYFTLFGHQKCLSNVDRLIVRPNRKKVRDMLSLMEWKPLL